MIVVACVLLFLAIKKDFEPYLLLPIAFGMLLVNLPYVGQEIFNKGATEYNAISLAAQVGLSQAQSQYIFTQLGVDTATTKQLHELVMKSDFLSGEALTLGFNSTIVSNIDHLYNYDYSGIFGFLYYGVKWGIYPCLIFLCIGATTDFGPLIANKKTMLLGAAAQIGIFITFIGAIALGKNGLGWTQFDARIASSIGIIGGADGPTAILVTTKLAPEYLSSIAIVAYSYMALVPVIQPPIIRLLTTKKERAIRMDTPREVSKTEKILFPIVVTAITVLIVPSAAPLIGCLMLGNLIKESGVVPKIRDTLANSLMYIVTILLGVCVGMTADAQTFLTLDTILIFVLGIVAFAVATAAGVLGGKLMCVLTKGKVNPMIGAAGVSAVPMAARVVHKEGLREDPTNFLLMHAMGPNVAGVIGSAVAAGVLLLLFA
ncbi:MAG: sodium ion-translocating decarboxylase subunit beta [Bacilli bacterium]|nr:sodium ion-translocating decarboxylase subunit beta [Bacilli bacterium]